MLWCGAFAVMPIERGSCRNSSSMPTPFGFFARGFSAAITISGTMVVRAQYEILSRVERRPERQQHGSRSAAPAPRARSRRRTCRQQKRVKTLLLTGAAAGVDRLARAHHVRRIDAVADHLRARNRPSRSRSCRTRRHAPAASRHGRPERGADSCRSWLRARCRPARRDNGASRTYSAGIVQSASSSNTQWPSDCWKPRTPCVADAMLDSRIFDRPGRLRVIAFTESILLDCSDS